MLDEADKACDIEMENQIRTVVAFSLSPIDRKPASFARNADGGTHFLSEWTIALLRNVSHLCSALGQQLRGVAHHASREQRRRNAGRSQQRRFNRHALGHRQHTIRTIPMIVRMQDTLLETLRSIPAPPVLVFVNSIAAIENLVSMLRLEQFHVCGIHSEYPQELRSAIVRAFREGGVDVLVCASLLERGIDFDVDEVILYEVPDTIEKVKHRAGRTGRGGRKGKVTVLITKECKILGEYKRLLKSSRQVR